MALPDLAGKIAGLPIHRLLGTYSRSIPVYATRHENRKIQPPHPGHQNTKICAAVRTAVGDDFLDAGGNLGL